MNSPEDPYDPATTELLIVTLNDLLVNLQFPIALDTPLDLTPSLLLGILESILRKRLPISPEIRASRDPFSKVQAMKIFIGVLEDDIIGEDVGLGDVDPRRLADGEWDEVVFVGELLCWLGKKSGLIPLTRASTSKLVDEQPFEPSRSRPVERETEERTTSSGSGRSRVPSPSTQSTVTTRNSEITALFLSRNARPADSDTTVITIPPDESPPLSDLDLFEPTPRTISTALASSTSSKHTPRCIHELEPSFIQTDSPDMESTPSPNFRQLPNEDHQEAKSHRSHRDIPPTTSLQPSPPLPDPSTPKRRTSTPVRYTGYIEQVDEDLELQYYHAKRRARAAQGQQRSSYSDTKASRYSDLGISSRSPSVRSTTEGIITRHTSPSQYTLALLNERAKLMEELARLRVSRTSS